MAFKTQNPPNKQQIKIQLDLRMPEAKKKRIFVTRFEYILSEQIFPGENPDFVLSAVCHERVFTPR